MARVEGAGGRVYVDLWRVRREGGREGGREGSQSQTFFICFHSNSTHTHFYLPSLLSPQHHPLWRSNIRREGSVHVGWTDADGAAGVVLYVALA